MSTAGQSLVYGDILHMDSNQWSCDKIVHGGMLQITTSYVSLVSMYVLNPNLYIMYKCKKETK